MEYFIIAIIAVALSATSLAVALCTALSLRKKVSALLDELSMALLARKKSKKVKRYILLKVVCSEEADIKAFMMDFENRVSKLLGGIERMGCSLTIASVSKISNRMIIRVTGDYQCFKKVLVALSIQHILFGGCVAIPIRTSGLFSRLRKWIY